MYKKHVCEKVHPGVSHEAWRQKQQDDIIKSTENTGTKPNPVDTEDPPAKKKKTNKKKKVFEIPNDVKKKAEDWWKKQKKIQPMEYNHGGKTKKSSKGSSGRYSQHN